MPFPSPECSIFLPSVTGQSVHATQQCLHLPLPLKFIISSWTSSFKKSQFKFFGTYLQQPQSPCFHFPIFVFQNNEMLFFVTFEPHFSCLIFKNWNKSIQYLIKPRLLCRQGFICCMSHTVLPMPDCRGSFCQGNLRNGSP